MARPKAMSLLACMLFIATILTAQDAGVAAKGASLDGGKRLFTGHCAPCHGATGEGGRGPNLARPTLQRASDDSDLFKLIQNGVPGSEMGGAWQIDVVVGWLTP